MELQVQKKDGRLEPFDRNKIKNGLIKSGASEQEAESVTTQVESWVQTVAVGNIVKTLDIRTKVLEILKGVNPVAATAFETYQKPQLEKNFESQTESSVSEESQVQE